MPGEDQWRLPLALAIGLHALGVLLIIFPPTFLFPRRDLSEVQTINLFDAGELMQQAASGPKQSANSLVKKASAPEPKKEEPPPKPEPKKEEPPPEPPKPEPPKPEPIPEPPKPEPVPEPPKPEPPKPEKVVPVEPPPKPIPTPPEKAISLEPKKVKKKIAVEKPPPEKPKPEVAKPEKAKPEKPVAKTDDKILKSLERIQAKVKEKQADQALKDKLSRLRDSLHEIATAKPSGSEPAPGAGGADAGGVAAAGRGGGPSSMLDEALKKYYIAISRKVHSNWALPDTQDWDSNLEAIAVIVIKRDGTVVETFFEKKSANVYFDQYVEKTIQAALPMPPIPSDIREDELEIGLKFRPSGLF